MARNIVYENEQKLELAADKLAKTTSNMQRLVDACYEKYPTRVM